MYKVLKFIAAKGKIGKMSIVHNCTNIIYKILKTSLIHLLLHYFVIVFITYKKF